MDKHAPKPLIEEHYHIRDLIERQEKRSNDRIYHQDQAKAKAERSDLIKEAKSIDLLDFWCRACKKDFKGVAIKQVETDWSCPTQSIAFYKTKCFEGHWCIRHITDKFNDPYWMNSKLVSLDRGNHYADIIQPFETGYSMLYGGKNR